jgi:hypothetical protein
MCTSYKVFKIDCDGCRKKGKSETLSLKGFRDFTSVRVEDAERVDGLH